MRRPRRPGTLRVLTDGAGARRATAAAVALAAWCAGCSDVDPDGSTNATPAERPASAPPTAARSLRDLAALGYAQWDEGVEEEETAEDRSNEVHDPTRVEPCERAWADDRSRIHVIDVDGRPVRTIEVPGRQQVEFARFLAGGRIACVGVDEGLTLLEADGSIVWHLDVACHHDVAAVPDGAPPGERTFALAVHHAREWQGRSVRFDDVLFIDERSGQPSASMQPWRTFEHRDVLLDRAGLERHPLDAPPEEPTDTTYDYFHLNSIAFDGPDAMLVCLRNVDLVVAIDLPSRTIGSGLGPGTLDWPHAPSIVERDGRRAVLVFDNGYHRGWSRAVELDRVSGEVLWEYRGTPSRPLFSRVRGYVERLPGGNTLITESERGRALEVTDEGEIVWEHWNPEVRETPRGFSRRRIYRMTAVDPAGDAAPAARSGTGGR
ncbi:MAG: arylsulfotransferase family protein [Planctomycetota bacterium]